MSLSLKLRKQEEERRTGAVRRRRHNPANGNLDLPSIVDRSKPYDNFMESPTRTKNQFERLSGSYDFSNQSGIQQNESASLLKPLSLCVRCSNHASMCMPCTELLCEQSLNFYRLTRARGAATLLQRAVVEAGMSKVLKYAIFRIWRNGWLSRSQQGQKTISLVKQFLGVNLTSKPFKAWKKWASENKLTRRDDKIEVLSNKLTKLEEHTGKQAKEIVELNNRIEKLEREKAASEARCEGLTETICELEDTLNVERNRVIALSSLAEPFQVLTSLLEDLSYKIQATIRGSLMHMNIPYHDYSNLPQTLGSPGTARSEVTEVSELGAVAKAFGSTYAISTNHMISWLAEKSREAGEKLDPVSLQRIGDFLPPHEDPDKEKEVSKYIQTGAILTRVIICLILDAQEYYGLNSSAGAFTERLAMKEGDDVGKHDADQLTIYHLQDIDELREDPRGMVTKALKLGQEFLRIPKFVVDNVLYGNKDICYALVAHLMLTSVPSSNARAEEAASSFFQKFSDIEQSILLHHREKTANIQKVARIHKAWAKRANKPIQSFANLVKNMNAGNVPASVPEEDTDEGDVSQEGAEGTAEGAAEGMLLEESGELLAEMQASESLNVPVEESTDQPSEQPKPRVSHKVEKKYTDAELYSMLTTAIDEFCIMSDGNGTSTHSSPLNVSIKGSTAGSASPSPTKSVRSIISTKGDDRTNMNSLDPATPITMSIAKTGEELASLMHLRIALNDWKAGREDGMKTACNFHREVSGAVIERLVRKLKWVPATKET